jgi:hypothetical protein
MEDAPQTGSVDVSAQGLRIEVDRVIPPGAFILLELEEAGSAEPVRLLSKVTWARSEAAHKGAEIGTRIVSFAGVSEERYARVLEAVAKETAEKK